MSTAMEYSEDRSAKKVTRDILEEVVENSIRKSEEALEETSIKAVVQDILERVDNTIHSRNLCKELVRETIEKAMERKLKKPLRRATRENPILVPPNRRDWMALLDDKVESMEEDWIQILTPWRWGKKRKKSQATCRKPPAIYKVVETETVDDPGPTEEMEVDPRDSLNSTMMMDVDQLENSPIPMDTNEPVSQGAPVPAQALTQLQTQPNKPKLAPIFIRSLNPLPRHAKKTKRTKTQGQGRPPAGQINRIERYLVPKPSQVALVGQNLEELTPEMDDPYASLLC